MKELLYIIWNPNEVIAELGFIQLRWYSMCWLFGLLFGYLIVQRLYKERGIDREKFEPLFIYCFVGILLGARLGHCIFYEPDYYLTSVKGFTEMWLPIRFLPDGGWRFVGYAGLASHGGTAGLMLALWLYCKRMRMKMWLVLDFIAIATPVCATFIRLGNLMNSEIIGKITDVPWAFIFEKVDCMPRHPGQLYEAIAYAILLFIGIAIYKTQNSKLNARPSRSLSQSEATERTQNSRFTPGSGFYFGLCLTYIFTARFFIEYTKEVQAAFENSLPIDMGQILSIPFIIIGVVCMMRKGNAM